MAQSQPSTKLSRAAAARIDRTNFRPPEGLMLQASLSSTLMMRQRIAVSARTPEKLRRRQARIAIDLAISYVFDVDAECLWSGRRGVRGIAEARQVAMYLAHVCCRMSLTEVGAMFGRDRTTVAHACLKVEYRRDDPNFDRALDVLGWALPTLVLREPPRDQTHLLQKIEDHEWL
jgi:chromosomal replication initiation ATPase DnaA